MEKNFNSLLSDKFPPSSLKDWLAQINKDLREGDYHSLVHHKRDDIAIQPAYTGEGLKTFAQAFRKTRYWGVMEEILVEDEVQANKAALRVLERGATGLLLYLNGSEDIYTVLKEVEIQYIKLRLVVEGDPQAMAQKLKKLIAERGLKMAELDIFFNRDPLENLARTGNWFSSETNDFGALKSLATNDYQPFDYHSINVNLFGNAGASVVQQLGIALAMTHETHHHLGDKTLAKYWVNFSLGGEYFMEIAKLRAFRRLWQQLADELGSGADQPLIYAETSLRNKSIKDVYNNMIRTTTEAMAAIVGGADELLVRSFDTTLGAPGEFGERVARNQQHILQYEGHLSQVQDIAGGSYFLERLTEEIAAKAWEFFVAIEENGGFIQSLKTGWLQARIEASAREEQEAYDKGKKFLVGVNKFAVEDANLIKLLTKPLFSSSNGQNQEIKPVRMIRLAEAFEKEYQNV